MKEGNDLVVYNFSAGPAMMPPEVVAQIQKELVSYKNSEMSVMEISHRSELYAEMFQEAKNDFRDLLAIPAGYKILFLQGGASLQFTTVPLNLARKTKQIAFVDTGHWSQTAIDDARLLTDKKVDVVATGKKSNYTTLPHDIKLEKEYDYVHLTINNTIEGTMYRKLPDLGGQTVVGDISSNILGYQHDVSKYGLLYASAQKNIGPAGLTLVVVKEDLLDQDQDLPSMLDYVKLIKKDSNLNTPPVFPIYAAGLVFKWLKQQGGVKQMQAQNEEKTGILYDMLDNSKLFYATANQADRSLTNVPFTTGDKALDAKFIAQADEMGLKNLKGHVLAGGMRASMYNAFPLEGVKGLVQCLQKFESAHKPMFNISLKKMDA